MRAIGSPTASFCAHTEQNAVTQTRAGRVEALSSSQAQQKFCRLSDGSCALAHEATRRPPEVSPPRYG